MSSLPPNLKLRDVIDRLKKIDKSFNLFKHKDGGRQYRWVLRRGENMRGSYPLTAPKGMDMLINRTRLKAIAKHFDISYEVFTLPIQELKTKVSAGHK